MPLIIWDLFLKSQVGRRASSEGPVNPEGAGDGAAVATEVVWLQLRHPDRSRSEGLTEPEWFVLLGLQARTFSLRQTLPLLPCHVAFRDREDRKERAGPGHSLRQQGEWQQIPPRCVSPPRSKELDSPLSAPTAGVSVYRTSGNQRLIAQSGRV